MDGLVRTRHAASSSGRGGRTATYKFYELRDILGLGPDRVLAAMADEYDAYLRHVTDVHGDRANRRMFGLAGSNFLGRRPAHDRFVTPSVIEAITLTGSPSHLHDRIKDIERCGVTHLAVLRQFDRPWADDEELEDLSRLIEQLS